MESRIQYPSWNLNLIYLVAFLSFAFSVQGQTTIEALEDCNCPEGTVGQRCLHDQLLDSIVSLEVAIQGYDATFERRDYAVRQLVGNKNVGAYDCAALVDSITSLNVQLINAMGCSDSESCNYNPASTSTVNCNYPTTWYFDGDGDGLGRADSTETACDASENFVSDNTDLCDDTLAYNYAADPTEACIMPPSFSALAPSNMNGETATINGSVTDDGGTTISDVGFLFNTDPEMPEGTNTDFPATLVDGELSVDLSSLIVGSTYYYQVYVTNEYGTTYSETRSFVAASGPCEGLTEVTDYDGNTYSLVEINGQCWTGENLKAEHWNDGTSIPQLFLPTPRDQNNPYRVVYNDDPATYLDILGYGYNYHVVHAEASGVRSLCPTGFNVPTRAAWDSIVEFAEGISTETLALQEMMSSTYWDGVTPGIGLNLTSIGVRQTNGTGGFGIDPFDGGTITPTMEQVRTEYATSTYATTPIYIDNDENRGTSLHLWQFFGQNNETENTHYSSTGSWFSTDTFVAVRCVKSSSDPGIVE